MESLSCRFNIHTIDRLFEMTSRFYARKIFEKSKTETDFNWIFAASEYSKVLVEQHIKRFSYTRGGKSNMAGEPRLFCGGKHVKNTK